MLLCHKAGEPSPVKKEKTMLVEGKWIENWQPVQAKDKDGRFVRQQSSFRNWVTLDGSAGPTGDAGFKAETVRYHLYVAYICPWASRTLMARKCALTSPTLLANPGIRGTAPTRRWESYEPHPHE
jgi:hypothetical protein